VRINTDGQANLVHGRDILPELAGLVDAVSVSLNAPDAETYQRLCRSKFGETGFQAVKDFLAAAKRHIPSVTATAVGLPGVDIEACRKVATDLGVDFRERNTTRWDSSCGDVYGGFSFFCSAAKSCSPCFAFLIIRVGQQLSCDILQPREGSRDAGRFPGDAPEIRGDRVSPSRTTFLASPVLAETASQRA
jgi:hypothetical protein